MVVIDYPYREILSGDGSALPGQFVLTDHIGGFNQHLHSTILDAVHDIAERANRTFDIYYIHFIDPKFRAQLSEVYPRINMLWSGELYRNYMAWQNEFKSYRKHPDLNYKNFVCSFNGSDHPSRRMLVAALERWSYYDPQYISKNFSFDPDVLDGHIQDYTGSNDRLYRKFFLGDNHEFCRTVNSFEYERIDHEANIRKLEQKLVESFVHVVSESMSTSCYPFVSEKFLYSVVTRGLFVTWGQPGWHQHLEEYWGFRLYRNIFDYRFDTLTNPVERLVEMMCMLSKFKNLSCHDWHDLYELETENIEFNYQHYYTDDYIKHLDQFST